MRNKSVVIFLAAILTLAATNNSSAQTFTRIKFAKGAVSKVVSGTLNGFNDRKIFKIKVRAGQTLSFEQVASENDQRPVTISLKDPSGEDATDMDASCNNRKAITPTIAGDYTLEVIECQKADEWNGGFRFRITVK